MEIFNNSTLIRKRAILNYLISVSHWCHRIPMDANCHSWRLNLTFRWIVNHTASPLSCHRDVGDSYRPITIPTTPFCGHLHGLTYQAKAVHVRTERVHRKILATLLPGLQPNIPIRPDTSYAGNSGCYRTTLLLDCWVTWILLDCWVTTLLLDCWVAVG